ncbi:MAG TPA: histidine kinase [Yinghuangia sp.]|nr:histidine kinase [Yinghuangia sp.]
MTLPDRFDVRLPAGWRVETVVGCVFGAGLAATLAQYVASGPSPALWAVDWALMLSTCAALWYARRRPVAMCAFALVATAAYYVFGGVDAPAQMVLLMIALHAVAASGRLGAATGLGAVTVAGVGLSALGGTDDITLAAVFMLAGWVVAVIALGNSRLTRQAFRREAEARVLAAEQGREAEARRRASDERLRIARELHDVIGHNISLINVQAGAALHRLAKDPAHAEEALGAIKTTSRETLRELRATLGVLRQVDEDAPTAPAAGLARAHELLAYAELAGLAAQYDTKGEPRVLPVEVDLAAYRIMQESLTNVTRHAAATCVELSVVYGVTGLRIEVVDDGAGAPGKAAANAGSGNGIRGMRERARALGGELAAGPRAGGGYGVRAYLPYESEETSR